MILSISCNIYQQKRGGIRRLNAVKLSDYQKRICEYYGARSERYGRGGMHPHLAETLVEFVGVNEGDYILDLATGTGLVAINVAKITGESGKVVGVDICKAFMEVAECEIRSQGLTNIQIVEGNIECLKLQRNQFDKIFLASALPYVSDVKNVMRQWKTLLKPGGFLGIQCQSGSAVAGGVVLQRIAMQYGTYINMSDDTKDPQTCRELFESAGFIDFEIKQEQLGIYIELQEALSVWNGSKNHPMCEEFFKNLSKEQEIKAFDQFKVELEEMVTDQGLWNDMTIYYVKGRAA